MAAIRNNIPVILSLAIGLIVMPIAVLGWDFSYIPGDLGDSRFNIYLLEHGYQFLRGKHEWYWNAPFMYPVENVITISDNLLGTVPIYSIFRIFGFDVFTAFQLWVVIVFALNFAAAYFLFKWLFENVYAASIAAFIFAFSISLQSQMAHAQVFARFFIPLAFLFLFKFGKTLNPKYFFLSALCLICQFYCGIYLGMFTLLPFTAVAFVLLILKHKLLFLKLQELRWWLLIVLSVCLSAIILFKLIWPYYQRSLISLPTDYEHIFKTIPRLISYFFAKNGSIIWESLSSHATGLTDWWDHQLFPGVLVFISLISAILILVKTTVKNQLEITLLFVVGIVTFLIFLRYNDYSLYKYIYKIPGFNSLRSITRIIGFDVLLFGLTMGILVKYLLEKFSKWRFFVFVCMLGLVVIDNFIYPKNSYRSSVDTARQRVALLKSKIKHLPKGSIISYEPDDSDNGVYVQLDAMLATQAFDLVCINGYSATSPDTFSPYWFEPNAKNRRFWLNSIGSDPEIPIVIK